MDGQGGELQIAISTKNDLPKRHNGLVSEGPIVREIAKGYETA
jgi:hypothetical protein